jgi:hypothetical protein
MVQVTPQPSWAQQPQAPNQGDPTQPTPPVAAPETPQPAPVPQAPETPQPPAETLQSKLTRWYGLKDQIAALTAQETTLRREIREQAFPNAPEKGSQRLGIGHGKDLKVTTKLNYSLDRAKLAEVGDNVLPQAVRDLVFKTKLEVVEAEVVRALGPRSDLAPEVRAALADVVTSKPALPQLEIVDAKKGG